MQPGKDRCKAEIFLFTSELFWLYQDHAGVHPGMPAEAAYVKGYTVRSVDLPISVQHSRMQVDPVTFQSRSHFEVDEGIRSVFQGNVKGFGNTNAFFGPAISAVCPGIILAAITPAS